ncbi:nucleoside recognition protein [Clostridium sp. D2Q-11]|uniref:Nucleoside recognition protein n=2 Tax=Anaeromonas frigoriresistens TaxID=2683708 RepID=A0A942Z8T6_9FIRM|nr:nucleoside recognition protein [Anaeromonas frigoriresistens]
MDIMLQYFGESISQSFSSILTISKVIIPLMIAMEFLKEYKIIDKLSNLLSPLSRLLGMSKKTIFPLVVGLTLGLAYGAGVIIQIAKEGKLSKKDLYLLLIFLVACHSVIEDTLLFVAMGANGWLLLSFRIVVALILTILASKNIDKILSIKEDKIKQGL